VTFVLCSESLDPGFTSENTFSLKLKENLHEGKSFTWFREAAKRFDWATHIGKLDMDMIPWDLHSITRRLRSVSASNTYVYHGTSIDYYRCNALPECPPQECTTVDHVAVQGDHCWAYMQGAFYIMSRPLAQITCEDGGYWQQHAYIWNHEDLLAGRSAYEASWKHNVSIYAADVPPHSLWYHKR